MRVYLLENGRSESLNKIGYVCFFVFIVIYQRQIYLRSTKGRSTFSHSGSGYTSPVGNMSEYQTPHEIKEEQWRLESGYLTTRLTRDARDV